MMLMRFIGTISLRAGANRRQKGANQFDRNYTAPQIAEGDFWATQKYIISYIISYTESYQFCHMSYDMIIYIESYHVVTNCILSWNTLYCIMPYDIAS